MYVYPVVSYFVFSVLGGQRELPPVLAFPSLHCEMTQAISLLTQQIAALFRENAQGNKSWADVLGEVGLSRGIQQRGDRYVNLDSHAA